METRVECAQSKSMRLQSTGLTILAVLALISFKMLFSRNMGSSLVNEVDVLPLAKQHIDFNWVPYDWYLNQPVGYRYLFEVLFGRMIAAWGFLATSIVGRLLCYLLVASGLVLIGQTLKLRSPLLLLAVAMFLVNNHHQGIAASEWIIGGLEAKAVSYGFVLLGIWSLLEHHYCRMALLLGIATSFHVLVGGWTFLAAVSLITLTRKLSLKQWGLVFILYLIASASAVRLVFTQMFMPISPSPIAPSFIYVFLRLPHHLNPLSWSNHWWIRPAIYLLLLITSMTILQCQQFKSLPSQFNSLLPQKTQIELFQLTLISLIPFICGLAIAPFDSQGILLQFYPFRLGDVMLPLSTCLITACAIQKLFTIYAKRWLSWVCISLLAVMLVSQLGTFQKQVLALNQFPKLNADYKALCEWVRTYTPKETIVITPPVEFANFTWLSERATIAKFKLVPQTQAEILDWYNRLGDLSGDKFPLPNKPRTSDHRKTMMRSLTKGYNQLTTIQAITLMKQYHSTYIMTHVKHQLELPIAYQNSRYILYSRNGFSAST